MKNIANVAVAIGILSLVIGIISRFTINPVNFKGLIPGDGLAAHAFLEFASTCFLAAIALIMPSMEKP